MGAVDHLERILIEQFIQEPVHGILDGRKSIMCSMNVVGVILLTVAICTVQAEYTYFTGKLGFKSCTNGSVVTNKTECVKACNQLKLPLKSMTDGQNCFKSGKGDCKQSASHGATAKLVCKRQVVGNSTGNSTNPTTKPTTIKPTTKPVNSTDNSTKPTTKPTTITPTRTTGNSTGNSTKPTTKPTTKPGNITGNSTKPTTKPTTIKPRTKPEFVYTVNGVTCSDYGLMDLAHPQECSSAVSYAKSFNAKAIFMSRTDHEDRHRGCFIYDSGAMWFNTHDTGSRSSYVTSICKKGCQNSDGLKLFYHTHDGYWTEGHTLQGKKTTMECANSCTQNCVAINTYATSSKKGDCYHYTNRTGLATANERQWDGTRAYIKCLGNSTVNSIEPTTKPTTIKPTTKPGCCPCTGNSTEPTTKPTTINRTTKPGNSTGNSTKPTTKPTTINPTTKPGNSTGNSTKPTTNSTTIKPTKEPGAAAVAPIFFNLTLNGVDETSFSDIKDILEQTIAAANNVPLPSVNANFVGMTPYTSTRSSDGFAVIKVIISPTDPDNLTEVLGKINNTEVFLSEINTELASHKVDVLSMSEVERMPAQTSTVAPSTMKPNTTEPVSDKIPCGTNMRCGNKNGDSVGS